MQVFFKMSVWCHIFCHGGMCNVCVCVWIVWQGLKNFYLAVWRKTSWDQCGWFSLQFVVLADCVGVSRWNVLAASSWLFQIVRPRSETREYRAPWHPLHRSSSKRCSASLCSVLSSQLRWAKRPSRMLQNLARTITLSSLIRLVVMRVSRPVRQSVQHPIGTLPICPLWLDLTPTKHQLHNVAVWVFWSMQATSLCMVVSTDNSRSNQMIIKPPWLEWLKAMSGQFQGQAGTFIPCELQPWHVEGDKTTSNWKLQLNPVRDDLLPSRAYVGCRWLGFHCHCGQARLLVRSHILQLGFDCDIDQEFHEFPSFISSTPLWSQRWQTCGHLWNAWEVLSNEVRGWSPHVK